MVKPISLRLSGAEITRRARLTVAQAEGENRLRRNAKLAGLNALNACRRAFALDQAVNQKFMRERAREGTKIARVHHGGTATHCEQLMRDLREKDVELSEAQQWSLKHRMCATCETAGKIVTAEYVASVDGGWKSLCFHCYRDLLRALRATNSDLSQLKASRMMW